MMTSVRSRDANKSDSLTQITGKFSFIVKTTQTETRKNERKRKSKGHRNVSEARTFDFLQSFEILNLGNGGIVFFLTFGLFSQFRVKLRLIE